MFKNSFHSSRSSSWDMDLLFYVNPYKILKNVHKKISLLFETLFVLHKFCVDDPLTN